MPAQPIDYRRPDPPSPIRHPFGVPTPQLAVAAFPVVAPLAVFLSWAHWLDEPFGQVEAVDVAIFGGAVAVTAGGCLAVPFLARWARVPAPLTILIVVWLAAWAYPAFRLLLPYFDEPWNY